MNTAIIIVVIIVLIFITYRNKGRFIDPKTVAMPLDRMEMEELRHRQRHTMTVLTDIVRLLDKYNIPYVAIGGTLIGAIRHHDMIPWDDDADLLLYPDGLVDLLYADNGYLQNKYPTQCRFWKDGASPFFFKIGGCVDLFVLKQVDPKDWSTGGSRNPGTTRERYFVFHGHQDNGRIKPMKESDLFPVQKASFGPLQISIPKRPMTIFENSYFNETGEMDINKLPPIERRRPIHISDAKNGVATAGQSYQNQGGISEIRSVFN